MNNWMTGTLLATVAVASALTEAATDKTAERELRQAITEIRQTLDRHLGASTGQKFLDEVRRAAENTR